MPSERAEGNGYSANLSTHGNGSATKSKRMKQGGNHASKNKTGPTTVETVRRIVAQEGRSARNLISWNAPLDMNDKPKSSATRHTVKPVKNRVKRRSKSYDIGASDKQKNSEAKSSTVVTSAKRQVSIRARYWAYLFDNLRRAVDEIYATCETDQSVVECKEVLLVLDNYRHDFQALIDWINLEERLNSTDIANRPTSLAWEVRKSSPGRPRQRMPSRGMNNLGIGIPEVPYQTTKNSVTDHTTAQPDSTIKRCLRFNEVSSGGFASATENHTNKSVSAHPSSASYSNQENRSVTDKKTPSASNVTWADRVKGYQRSPRSQTRKVITPSQNTVKVNTVNENTQDADDEGGWEKVASRGKQAKKSVKAASATNGTVNSPVRNQTTLKISDIDEPVNKSSPVTKHEKVPEYSGFVVERSMGTSSSASYASCTNAEKPLGEVLFCNDGSNKDDFSLKTLDDVEAQFFKNDNAMASEDEDASVLGSMESDSKANVALREHDASIAAAEQEEQQLMKEIEAEENAPCDTDAEATNDTESVGMSSSSVTPRENSDWNSIMARFEIEQELHRGMSWGDMIDDEDLREPGRAVQMHEKLSSPSRKRTPAESKRKMEEKQRSATLRRQKMVQDKTERIQHFLSVRVADVRRLKEDLIMGRTELLKELHMEKLQRAQQQRDLKLMKIRQKAQAEETKVNEILFINELQEQNKRHDVLNRILEHDARLLELQQERSKMFEVKAAKEENVKERRRLLEKERQDRLSELINKRKDHDSRIEQLKQEREKEREKQAREKERDRKTRLSALNAAQQEAVEELQKKIQIKHDESERRHQEQLEQRKEKALELSLGRFSLSSSGNMPPGEMQNAISEGDKVAKTSAAANIQVDLTSIEKDEVHETGKGDAVNPSKTTTSDNSVISPRTVTIVDDKKAAKKKEAKMMERKKAMKKRAKKLKTRMVGRGQEFFKALDDKSTTISMSKNKVARLVKDIKRKLTSQKDSSGPWPASRAAALDRSLGELARLLEKKEQDMKSSFRICGGFETLEQIFELPINSNLMTQKGEAVSILPDRTIANAAVALKTACEHSYDNAIYVLYSCRFVVLVDVLSHQLTKCMPDVGSSPSNSKSPLVGRKFANASNNKSYANPESRFNPAASALLDTVAFCLGYLASHPPVQDDGSILIRDNKQLAKAIRVACIVPQKALSTELNPKKLSESFLNRGLDVVSYIVSTGVLDQLSVYLNSVRSEIEANGNAAGFIEHGLLFLNAVTEFVALRNRMAVQNTDGRTRRTSVSSNASTASNDKAAIPPVLSDIQTWEADSTQLLPTLYHTELMGVVSVLYGILLHGAPERPILLRNKAVDLGDVVGSEPPREIPAHVLDIAMSVMVALNAVAELDIFLLQESLGAEGVSLEFRHICTYLLWYCQHGDRDGLLHEVIICVGHFVVLNKKNQELVHSGAMPTVLQQLCILPFAYFSNPALTHILFPTLIACCHDNKTNLSMLEQEASGSLLSSYIKGILDEADNSSDDAKLAVERSSGSFAGLKRRSSISLSSNRLYTVSFLKDAMNFFSQR